MEMTTSRTMPLRAFCRARFVWINMTASPRPGVWCLVVWCLVSCHQTAKSLFQNRSFVISPSQRFRQEDERWRWEWLPMHYGPIFNRYFLCGKNLLRAVHRLRMIDCVSKESCSCFEEARHGGWCLWSFLRRQRVGDDCVIGPNSVFGPNCNRCCCNAWRTPNVSIGYERSSTAPRCGRFLGGPYRTQPDRPRQTR